MAIKLITLNNGLILMKRKFISFINLPWQNEKRKLEEKENKQKEKCRRDQNFIIYFHFSIVFSGFSNDYKPTSVVNQKEKNSWRDFIAALLPFRLCVCVAPSLLRKYFSPNIQCEM